MQGLGATRCFACYNMHAHELRCLRCLNLPRVLYFSHYYPTKYTANLLFPSSPRNSMTRFTHAYVYIHNAEELYTRLFYEEHTHISKQSARESRSSSHFSVNYWHGKWSSKGQFVFVVRETQYRQLINVLEMVETRLDELEQIQRESRSIKSNPRVYPKYFKILATKL